MGQWQSSVRTSVTLRQGYPFRDASQCPDLSSLVVSRWLPGSAQRIATASELQKVIPSLRLRLNGCPRGSKVILGSEEVCSLSLPGCSWVLAAPGIP